MTVLVGDIVAGIMEFRLLDIQGRPVPNEYVLLYGNSVHVTATDAEDTARLRLHDPCGWSGHGPNVATLVGDRSDRVKGLGLPGGHSVHYAVTLPRQSQPTIPDQGD